MKTFRNARTMTETALGAALMVICSLVAIPAAVPFTLQTFGVFVILVILGAKKGGLSIALFILLGLTGLPVFSGARGGPAALFGPTGGYILGFLLTALCWRIGEKSGVNRPAAQAACLAVGLLLCYAFGTAWFVVRYAGGITLEHALSLCVWPFVLPDLVKLALALAIGPRVRKALAR